MQRRSLDLMDSGRPKGLHYYDFAESGKGLHYYDFAESGSIGISKSPLD